MTIYTINLPKPSSQYIARVASRPEKTMTSGRDASHAICCELCLTLSPSHPPLWRIDLPAVEKNI